MKPTFDTFIGREPITQAQVADELFEAIREPISQEMSQIRENIEQMKYDQEKKIEAYNIIIFGPTGSGKSSFIR